MSGLLQKIHDEPSVAFVSVLTSFFSQLAVNRLISPEIPA